jgi:hypothetical protein
MADRSEADPRAVRLKQFLCHVADLVQSANRGRQGVKRDGLIYGLAVLGHMTSHHHFLQPDTGPQERSQLGGKVPYEARVNSKSID